VELIPLRAAFAPGEPIELEIVGADEQLRLDVRRLARVVCSVVAERGETVVALPALPVGGYGVDATGALGGSASTALDVLERPLDRLRYGFACDFAAGRDLDGIALHARRLHLNAIQLYDWMYRHEQLVPPADDFRDALGRELSLTSVRGVVESLRAVGAQALAYAAVYAVGRAAREAWADAALLRPDGTQWQLGDDFLWLVDPSHPRWVEHLAGDLVGALAATGAAGFHLDQYGWPKAALDSDGRPVELAAAFPALLSALPAALPEASLIFNNVNDFPSWSTAASPLAASYVEVWPPHTGLEHIAGLAQRTRALAPDRPAVLAAYPSVLASAPAEQARPALELLLATAFSHGATVLSTGESGAVLVDPYYPRHHLADVETLELLREMHDVLVRFGDVLVGPGVDITRTHAGGINEEIVVEAPGVTVATDPLAGSLWLRVVDTPQARVVHLINLVAQPEAGWDTPKRPVERLAGATLRLRRERADASLVAVASRTSPVPQVLPSRAEGDVDVIELPPLGAWTMVLVTYA
jgi:dextranase